MTKPFLELSTDRQTLNTKTRLMTSKNKKNLVLEDSVDENGSQVLDSEVRFEIRLNHLSHNIEGSRGKF